jgi:anti-sigma factor RsiW
MSGLENFETRLEQELTKALQRDSAPEGFAEGVLARVREEETRQPQFQPSWFAFLRQPVFRLAATVVVFLVMIGGMAEYRRYEQQKEAGQVAKRQLMEALRVTGAKLHYARQKVNELEAQQYGIDSEESEKLQ